MYKSARLLYALYIIIYAEYFVLLHFMWAVWGVAKFQNIIILCLVIRHIVAEFDYPNTYSLADIGVHTDRVRESVSIDIDTFSIQATTCCLKQPLR